MARNGLVWIPETTVDPRPTILTQVFIYEYFARKSLLFLAKSLFMNTLRLNLFYQSFTGPHSEANQFRIMTLTKKLGKWKKLLQRQHRNHQGNICRAGTLMERLSTTRDVK